MSLVCLTQALRHELIPVSLHCEEESDYFDWQQSCFFVNRSRREWSRGNKPRLGAVSAFGMSGTNAHVILEEYISAQPVVAGSAPYYLLVFSAKTEAALEARVSEFRQYLEKSSEERSLAAISHTLLCGRRHFAYRCAMVVANVPQALVVCASRPEGAEPNVFQGKVGKLPTIQPSLLRYGNDWIDRIVSSTVAEEEYHETLRLLADLYRQGYELQWERLGEPRRLHMPAYPFARDQHWITASAKIVANERPAATPPAAPDMLQSLASLPGDIPRASSKPEKIVLSSLYDEPDRFEGLKTQIEASIRNPLGDSDAPLAQLRDLETTMFSPQAGQGSRKRLIDDLATSLADTLYLDGAAIDQQKTFLEMGLDSITGVEWMRTLNRCYGLSIPVTKLYDHPTIPLMAEFLEKELQRAGLRPRSKEEREPLTAVDEILRQVFDGAVSVDEAKSLLQ